MPLFFRFDLSLEARAEILKIYRSHFGRNDDFILAVRKMHFCKKSSKFSGMKVRMRQITQGLNLTIMNNLPDLNAHLKLILR